MKLILENIPLKSFLKIFKPEDSILVIELGDFFHPSNGFVDETILGKVGKVKHILNLSMNLKAYTSLIYVIAYFE